MKNRPDFGVKGWRPIRSRNHFYFIMMSMIKTGRPQRLTRAEAECPLVTGQTNSAPHHQRKSGLPAVLLSLVLSLLGLPHASRAAETVNGIPGVAQNHV